ncbi:hypothetical protein MB84_28890 (plasmid) [Pandoraea oxalativorans]|uniref:Uncharacterized protein n=1 Tax=Pandoraea oxalativorans TaxID=573737 RepID=A0A192B148_9BURK|nr:hypothetical protein MB84_28890 [Pandoraea oxalativorans]
MQVHFIDPHTGGIVNKSIKRAQCLENFANRAPCLIGREACSSAHHWARRLMRTRHEVRLMPARFVTARFVKALNIRNKSDAVDAKAIRPVVRQPSKAVAVKTEMQQAVRNEARVSDFHRGSQRQHRLRQGRM